MPGAQFQTVYARDRPLIKHQVPGLTLVNTANELNAGYAAGGQLLKPVYNDAMLLLATLVTVCEPTEATINDTRHPPDGHARSHGLGAVANTLLARAKQPWRDTLLFNLAHLHTQMATRAPRAWAVL